MGIILFSNQKFKNQNKMSVVYSKKKIFQQLRLLELAIAEALSSPRSKHLPPIKRGGEIDVYLTTSGWKLTFSSIVLTIFLFKITHVSPVYQFIFNLFNMFQFII